MTLHSIALPGFDFACDVERLYTALLTSRKREVDIEPGLGGRFLYAGDLNASTRAWLVAGNIAGAASLAVTANPAAQKQAIHEGVADFPVNSLDEALRVLKNEIRKHEPVAVCIAADPRTIENEMLERGVMPDLLAPGFANENPFAFKGSRLVVMEANSSATLLCWSVSASPARWLPKLDAMALECLGTETNVEAQTARRWLRLAPRYLGRLAQNFRVLRCSTAVADAFETRVLRAVNEGQISPVEIIRKRVVP